MSGTRRVTRQAPSALPSSRPGGASLMTNDRGRQRSERAGGAKPRKRSETGAEGNTQHTRAAAGGDHLKATGGAIVLHGGLVSRPPGAGLPTARAPTTHTGRCVAKALLFAPWAAAPGLSSLLTPTVSDVRKLGGCRALGWVKCLDKQCLTMPA